MNPSFDYGKLNQAYMALLSSDRSASEKFWAPERRSNEDKKRPGVQLMLQKSNVVSQLAVMMYDETIRPADLDGFSDELKEAVQFYLDNWG